MNNNGGHCSQSSRQPTVPPLSCRTLHHPSLVPLYMAAGFTQHHAPCCVQTVHPIVLAECFYIDPTMICGRRIPNIMSELSVFDCFQLNTPAPVMSPCLVPPSAPDPFRTRQHPTVSLGSFTWRTNTQNPPVQRPSRVILQLTHEEDQAITNLLKLHHQEPTQSLTVSPDSSFVDLDLLSFHPETIHSYVPAEDVQRYTHHCPDAQQGRCWSDTELEAANTLLSGFSPTEMDEICGQSSDKPAAAPHDSPPDHRQASETQPGLIPTGWTANNTGYVSVTNVEDSGGRRADDVYEECSSIPALSSDSSPTEVRAVRL